MRKMRRTSKNVFRDPGFDEGQADSLIEMLGRAGVGVRFVLKPRGKVA